LIALLPGATLQDLREAKAVPTFKDGKFNGYRLSVVKPGSLFQRLGLKPGDVVQTAGGRAVGQPGG
jgi:general secretion pathway protein C